MPPATGRVNGKPNGTAALDVVATPIGDITAYAKNPRKNEAAIAKTAASIQEFGWRQPIVVDESGTIIAGHTRLLAARQLGLDTVPVHVARGLTPAQVRAYRLADNRTGQEAEWDLPLLSEELADLKALDFDLSVTGFDDDEMDRIAGEVGLVDPASGGAAPVLGQGASGKEHQCPRCGYEW